VKRTSVSSDPKLHEIKIEIMKKVFFISV